MVFTRFIFLFSPFTQRKKADPAVILLIRFLYFPWFYAYNPLFISSKISNL